MTIFGDGDSSSSSGSSNDLNLGDGAGNTIDQELQHFLMLEKHKAQFNSQIHVFNDFCWEKCFTDKPKSKLDNKTKTCLSNCVDRFIDVSLLITTRFAATLQKSAKL